MMSYCSFHSHEDSIVFALSMGPSPIVGLFFIYLFFTLWGAGFGTCLSGVSTVSLGGGVSV